MYVGSDDIELINLRDNDEELLCDWMNENFTDNNLIRPYLPIYNTEDLIRKVQESYFLCLIAKEIFFIDVDYHAETKTEEGIAKNYRTFLDVCKTYGVQTDGITTNDLKLGSKDRCIELTWNLVKYCLNERLIQICQKHVHFTICSQENSLEKNILNLVNNILRKQLTDTERVINFEKDLTNSVIYSYILENIVNLKQHLLLRSWNSDTVLKEPDLSRRALLILSVKRKLGGRLIGIKDILMGHFNPNLIFTADLIEMYYKALSISQQNGVDNNSLDNALRLRLEKQIEQIQDITDNFASSAKFEDKNVELVFEKTKGPRATLATSTDYQYLIKQNEQLEQELNLTFQDLKEMEEIMHERLTEASDTLERSTSERIRLSKFVTEQNEVIIQKSTMINKLKERLQELLKAREIGAMESDISDVITDSVQKSEENSLLRRGSRKISSVNHLSINIPRSPSFPISPVSNTNRTTNANTSNYAKDLERAQSRIEKLEAALSVIRETPTVTLARTPSTIDQSGMKLLEKIGKINADMKEMREHLTTRRSGLDLHLTEIDNNENTACCN
ncbi:hypothetical protein HK098_004015 [Nowakowskiella sp. JEL0407]|nr:hypothetical protein HK098_004015 [Nowakowskiella sp. JEL0407]